MKILLTGGEGYISKIIFENFKNSLEITKISRKDFDLTDSFETLKFFSNRYFDVVIHCAVVGGSRLKIDDFTVMDDNLKMYYNLLNCQNKYGRFIHFGSGAEIYKSDSPYGLSKKVIHNSIKEKENFFDIRIFAVFDEHELESRFIKSNILRYIKKEPLKVFDNKEMDFFYSEDFTTLVKHYIFSDSNKLPKTYECTYDKTYKTIEIAEMINNLSSYSLPIVIDGENSTPYKGQFVDLGIEYVGLEKGINKVYEKLKNKDEQ